LDAVGREGAGVAVAPMHDVAGDGVLAGVGDRAQRQAVRRAFVDVGVAADRDRRCDVVHMDGQRIGSAGGGDVFIDQVDGGAVVVGAVGVGVRLDTVGRVGAGGAVAPVHDVAGDRVLPRVGDVAEGEAVAGALVDARVAADRDGGRDVVHMDGEGLAVAAAVGVCDRDRDRVVVGAVGIGVAEAPK